MNIDPCAFLSIPQVDDLGRRAIANAGSVYAEVQVIPAGYAYDFYSDEVSAFL